MKKFILLLTIVALISSCQKQNIEPIEKSAIVLSLTDSTKLALFNTSFTVVFDELVSNDNAVYSYSVPSNRRMYDTWTIDAVGNCTVVAKYYDCPKTYNYDRNNFNYNPALYTTPLIFSISISGDTIILPYYNPFSIMRANGTSISHDRRLD